MADSQDFIFLIFIITSVRTSIQHFHIVGLDLVLKKYYPLLPWPPRSYDLTPCHFILWGYVKDHVFVPPLRRDLAQLRGRVVHAAAGFDRQMLGLVCDYLDYRIYVIWNTCKVCAETLRDSLSSDTNVFAMFAMDTVL